MYLSHYNLSHKPFQTTADPQFIWLGEKHAEALATLQYGLQENKGFLLLTGDAGTGKTAVINTLLERLDEQVLAVTIPDPGLDAIDLYTIISNELKMNRKFTNKGDFLNILRSFLKQRHLKNKSILLIIDEAQHISQVLVDEIRLLSNIEVADTKLINILIAGQKEVHAVLNEKRNAAFKQRIGIQYHLEPLTGSETHEYINHRLKVAGSDEKIFSSKAIKDIHSFSAGIPRLINAICDLALLTGYSSDKSGIDQKIIAECARDLKLSCESETLEAETRTGVEGEKPPVAGRNRRAGWGRFNLAAVIVGLILITGFIIYNVYPNRPHFPRISEEALRDYKRYEEKINHVKKKLRSDKQETVDTPVERRNNEKNDNKNIGGKSGFRQSCIIYFNNASLDLSPNSLDTLDKLAGSMRDYPNSEIIIESHTDSRGNYWRNKKLSTARTNLVKNYFVKLGILASRIKTYDRGAKYPIISNDTELGAKINHRVEIKIVFSRRNLFISKN